VARSAGAGYLILVGHKPGTANGDFELRVDLVLPPDNDDANEASPLGRLPATVRRIDAGRNRRQLQRMRDVRRRRLVPLSRARHRTRDRPARSRRARRRGRGLPPHPRRRARDRVSGNGPPRTRRCSASQPSAATSTCCSSVTEPARVPASSRSRSGQARRPSELPGHALPRGGVRGSVDGTDRRERHLVGAHSLRDGRIESRSAPRRAHRHASGEGGASSGASLPGLHDLHSRRDGRWTVRRRGGGARRAHAGRVYRLQVVAAQADDLGVGVEIVPGSGPSRKPLPERRGRRRPLPLRRRSAK
jgi:hypothetical protein